jgi:hypothetical protein
MMTIAHIQSNNSFKILNWKIRFLMVGFCGTPKHQARELVIKEGRTDRYEPLLRNQMSKPTPNIVSVNETRRRLILLTMSFLGWL